jgi:DNA-binding MarR family transcriptional regulator
MKFNNYQTLKSVLQTAKARYDFTLDTLLVFLEVCQADEGISVTQLMNRLDLTQSAASRHARLLTDRFNASREGLGLCEFVIDPKDYRSKLLVLTEEGKEFERELEAALRS